jgi:geranylgeranyl diphosphate synthase type I
MFLKIKKRVDSELTRYVRDLDRLYSLNAISPILSRRIKEFITRKGKRIRPILFAIGYLGFAKKPASGLYRSALSIELLHDFMLVHDDIIDRSSTRRGKPSMHAMFNKYLTGRKGIKFSGEDLAIVTGDVLYAMALHTFLSVREENPKNKEAALKKLIESAFYTGCGEFIELLYGGKGIEEIKKDDIYKIYDLKTANYTFASPLTIGATLAGAKEKEIRRLFQYGIYLGRAFQIQDDILGIFSEEKEIGKSNLTDLQEAKKTLLIWYAYHNARAKDKAQIRAIMAKKKVRKTDLVRMRRIIAVSGSLDYAKKEIHALANEARALNQASSMKKSYKKSLDTFSQEILSL